VRDLVLAAAATGQRIRVVGAAHSWSRVAMTDDWLVNLDGLSGVIDLDEETGRVTVWAGTRLFDLNEMLAERGLAMSNLGSVSQQSVAGALSTGTHGSGPRHGVLASQAVGLRLLTAAGVFLDLDEADDRLMAARVSLGALGIITRVTLQCVGAFRLRCTATPMAFDAALDALPELIEGATFVKYWWLPHTDQVQVFVYEPTDALSNTSALAAWVDEHIINRYLFPAVLWISRLWPRMIPSLNRVIRLGYFRPADRVDRSDRLFTLATPARHEEMEVAIPIEHAADAMRGVRQLIEQQQLYVNFIVELRFVAAGDEWLSPAYQRDSAYIGAYIAGGSSERPYLEGVEELTKGWGGRPHWGKTFYLSSEDLGRRYPRWDDFCALRAELDPEGMFSSPFCERVFGGD
jgi:FAD-linked oxidoreductase